MAYSNLGALPFFVAENQGYFAQANIVVVGSHQYNTTGVSNALLNNQADAGFTLSYADAFNDEAASPGAIKMFMVGSEVFGYTNNTGIIVMANSPYNSVADLKGKTIGLRPDRIADGISARWIVSKYFNQSDAKYVAITQVPVLTALAQNQVDALYVSQPIINVGAMSNLTRELPNSTCADIMNPIPQVGAAFTASFVAGNPDLTGRMVAVVDKAIAYIKANPQSAIEILANYTDTPIDELHIGNDEKTGWNYYTRANGTIGNASVAGQLQALADKYYASGYIGHRINVSDGIYR
ncbi:NMT1/THI5 like protein [uncultured archaeon]|nr:NMT1/THI5 like protein [uncultured archaeon]